MERHRMLAGCLALALAGAGCSGPAVPTAPVADAEPSHLVVAYARVDDTNLVVTIRAPRDLFEARDQDLQVFVDTDGEAGTGYGSHGDEYVARLVETTDGRSFPVRHTEPGLLDSPGGWGVVTGSGAIEPQSFGIRLRIPLATLGNDDGRMRLRVEYFDHGRFDYRDLATDPGFTVTR